MTIIELVALIGFILGSILHTILSILIIQRKNKKGSELVFLFLVISVAMWHYGNVISLFSIMLFGKDIPIIMFSRLSAKEDIDRAFELGATDYMIKCQHSPEDVVAVVRKRLDG